LGAQVVIQKIPHAIENQEWGIVFLSMRLKALGRANINCNFNFPSCPAKRILLTNQFLTTKAAKVSQRSQKQCQRLQVRMLFWKGKSENT
jgi:hypothetical protein